MIYNIKNSLKNWKTYSLAMFLLTPILSFGQLAFPCAEGLGANSIGGRGGDVVYVTNLNDSGAGSFREAVTTSPRHYATGSVYSWESEADYLQRLDGVGHKTVVFNVSGIINLESDIMIRIPYLTIAGQTSPGGILITGYQTTVNTHHLIMRHMRFRVGSHRVTDGSAADPEKLDAFDIWGAHWGGYPAHDIIVDHCSFSWGVDETVSITGGVTNTTIQWSIISEGLRQAGHPSGEHSKGLLISGKYVESNSVSVHHNYIAQNGDRVPQIASPVGVDTQVEVINNVTYNWKGGLSPSHNGSPLVNWIHNYARPGFNAHSYSYELRNSNLLDPAEPIIYTYGNIGSSRLTQTEPQWNVGFSWQDSLLSEDFRSLTPFSFISTITTTEMSDSYASAMIQTVGATKPFRDSVDIRVIADFDAGTGQLIDNVIFPTDFPTFQNIAAPADSDSDGMSDSWEISKGLNISDPTDRNNTTLSLEGYTNLEVYLNELAGDTCGTLSTDVVDEFQQNNQNNSLGMYFVSDESYTDINFKVHESGKTTLIIYDFQEKIVSNLMNDLPLKAQSHKVRWNNQNQAGSRVSNGLYIAHLQVGNLTQSKFFYVGRH